LANDGDTVAIPACGATTWSSGIDVDDKAVQVEGAGIGVTTINLSGGIVMFTLSGTSAGNNVGTVGNMTITGSGDDNGFLRAVSTYRVRFHHLAIGDVSQRAILFQGTYGLIDHVAFTTEDGYNAIQVLGSEFSPSGNWTSAMSWGTANAVYIEDNTFSATNCVTGLGVFDGFNGSKIVFRYNSVVNWQSYVHGFDSASESALQEEIYENSFDMQKMNCAIDRMVFIRGGTGYAFNNTMHLTDPHNLYNPSFISLYYYRDSVPQQGEGICDGTEPIDGNTPGEDGWLCYQQPGAGGPGPHSSVPWYSYNNVGTGNMPADLEIRSESDHVELGRDYFDDTPMPGYTPYVYPNPLQGGATTPTVTTTSASSIGTTTASSGGNVTSDGGDAVTVRGVCRSTSSNPTTSDTCTSDGTGTGSFSSSLTGMSPATLYHIRAYATNGVGTSYGSDLTFTTLAIAGKSMRPLGAIVIRGKVKP
jgi:hypothetical protein